MVPRFFLRQNDALWEIAKVQEITPMHLFKILYGSEILPSYDDKFVKSVFLGI